MLTGISNLQSLVEKLIRSCAKIKRIFLLIREKKDKRIEERLDDLISSKVRISEVLFSLF